MKRTILMTVVSLVLAGASAADAATYSGRSSKGTAVTLQTNGAGIPNLIEFGDYKLGCLQGNLRVRNPITGFEAPFDAASAQRVTDYGRVKKRIHVENLGHLHVVGTWNLSVAHNDRDQWAGEFQTDAVYYSHGDPYERCRIGFDFRLNPS